MSGRPGEHVRDGKRYEFYEALERAQAVPGIGKAALKIGVFTDQISEFRKMLKEETPIKDVIEAILDKTGYRDELKEEGEVEAESEWKILRN